MKVTRNSLREGMEDGYRHALSKLIPHVENRKTGCMGAIKLIFKDTGKTRIFGIQGLLVHEKAR